jgi:hypothetical protein
LVFEFSLEDKDKEIKRFGIAVTTLICIGLSAVLAQAAAVHYTFDETAPGSWDVSVEVTGADTAGLSAYSLWVKAPSGAGVSFAQNILATVDAGFATYGFASGNVSQIAFPTLDLYSAGNFQTLTAKLLGVGMVAIDDPGAFPPGSPHVQLVVPALLGTFTTPVGLGVADLYPGDAGLFNAAGDAFHSAPPAATFTVNPIPEPVTLTLLGLGGLALLIRRRR